MQTLPCRTAPVPASCANSRNNYLRSVAICVARSCWPRYTFLVHPTRPLRSRTRRQHVRKASDKLHHHTAAWVFQLSPHVSSIRSYGGMQEAAVKLCYPRFSVSSHEILHARERGCCRLGTMLASAAGRTLSASIQKDPRKPVGGGRSLTQQLTGM